MGDKFGTKKIFVISLILFSIGLMMCGLSTSIEQLIFWRLIQGLGGGLLIPVGQTMA
jgi:MFS family permease